MKTWSLHDLRRTVATRLSELGAPPHVVENCWVIICQALWRGITYMITDDQRHWLAVWQDHLEKLIGQPLV